MSSRRRRVTAWLVSVRCDVITPIALLLTVEFAAGDEIVVVIKRARPISTALAGTSQAAKVRRGDVRRAVVVRTKYPTRRPDGRYIRFDDNAAVLVNSKKEMIGNRIGGVVAAELRSKGWGKIVSLAPKVS